MKGSQSGKPQLAGTAARRRCGNQTWDQNGSENVGISPRFMDWTKQRYGFLPRVATFSPTTCKSSTFGNYMVSSPHFGHKTHSRCATTNLRTGAMQPRDRSSTGCRWRWDSKFLCTHGHVNCNVDLSRFLLSREVVSLWLQHTYYIAYIILNTIILYPYIMFIYV